MNKERTAFYFFSSFSSFSSSCFHGFFHTEWQILGAEKVCLLGWWWWGGFSESEWDTFSGGRVGVEEVRREEEDVRGAETHAQTRKDVHAEAELHSVQQEPSCMCTAPAQFDSKRTRSAACRHLPALILQECDGPTAACPLHNICIPTADIRTRGRFESPFEFVEGTTGDAVLIIPWIFFFPRLGREDMNSISSLQLRLSFPKQTQQAK